MAATMTRQMTQNPPAVGSFSPPQINSLEDTGLSILWLQGTAHHAVCAQRAVQRVVAYPALQRVVATPAVQPVVALTAVQHVDRKSVV